MTQPDYEILDVWATGAIVRADGAQAEFLVRGDRECETGAVLLEAETIAVRIVDRREWDAAHPGVEPTDAVLRDLFADGDLAEDVADAADAEAADGYSPPDDEPEDYEWCLP